MTVASSVRGVALSAQCTAVVSDIDDSSNSIINQTDIEHDARMSKDPVIPTALHGPLLSPGSPRAPERAVSERVGEGAKAGTDAAPEEDGKEEPTIAEALALGADLTLSDHDQLDDTDPTHTHEHTHIAGLDKCLEGQGRWQLPCPAACEDAAQLDGGGLPPRCRRQPSRA